MFKGVINHAISSWCHGAGTIILCFQLWFTWIKRRWQYSSERQYSSKRRCPNPSMNHASIHMFVSSCYYHFHNHRSIRISLWQGNGFRWMGLKIWLSLAKSVVNTFPKTYEVIPFLKFSNFFLRLIFSALNIVFFFFSI